MSDDDAVTAHANANTDAVDTATREDVAGDAHIAAQYLKLLLTLGVDHADAVELTKTYVTSKAHVRVQIKEVERTEKEEPPYTGMKRGMGREAFRKSSSLVDTSPPSKE